LASGAFRIVSYKLVIFLFYSVFLFCGHRILCFNKRTWLTELRHKPFIYYAALTHKVHTEKKEKKKKKEGTKNSNE